MRKGVEPIKAICRRKLPPNSSSHAHLRVTRGCRDSGTSRVCTASATGVIDGVNITIDCSAIHITGGWCNMTRGKQARMECNDVPVPVPLTAFDNHERTNRLATVCTSTAKLCANTWHTNWTYTVTRYPMSLWLPCGLLI